MATYDEEGLLISDSVGAPPPAALFEPSPIGLGMDTQAPAPVVDLGPGMPPLNPAQKSMDSRKAAIAQMSGPQKFLAALGEAGAGLLGRPSPLETRLRGERENRLLEMKEFQLAGEIYDTSLKRLGSLSGQEREKYATEQAARLNRIDPGLGDSLITLSRQPDVMQSLGSLSEIPAVQTAFRVGGADAVKALVKSPTFYEKTVQPHLDEKQVPLVMRKVKAMADQFKLAHPDRWEQIQKDGVTASEVMEMSEAFANRDDKFASMALNDRDRAVLTRNEDRVYGALGIITTKDEAEIRKKKVLEGGKSAMKPGTVTEIPLGGKNFAKGVYDPDKTLFPDAEHDANGFAILGKGTKDGTTINFPSSSGMGVNPATGKAGHYTIGKDGTIRWDAVEPMPKEVDPLKKVIADALGGAAGAPPAAPRGGAPKPAAVPAGIPAGSKKIGKSPDGKDVWQSPDGRKWVP